MSKQHDPLTASNDHETVLLADLKKVHEASRQLSDLVAGEQ